MESPWYIIVNPRSGGGKAGKSWPAAEQRLRELGISYEVVFTNAPLHAVSLAQAGIDRGFRRFAVAGGDGTLNEVINGLFSHPKGLPADYLFAAIPIGTGSDWARMYRIPRQPQQAIELLTNGKHIRQDIGRLRCQTSAGEKVCYFDNVAGLGYDAYVTQKTAHIAKNGVRGQFFYFRALLSGLLAYHPVSLRFEADTFDFEGKIYSANVAICRYNGGGMRPAPKADPNDGLFDITIIEDLNLIQVLSNLIRLYNGKLYQHRLAHHFRAKSVQVSSIPDSLVEIDGEVPGQLPASFELLPDALMIVVPQDTP